MRGGTANWEEEVVVLVEEEEEGEEEEEEEEEEDSPPLASHAVMSCASQWPNRVPRPLARGRGAPLPRHAYDRSTFTLVVGHKAANGRRPTSA